VALRCPAIKQSVTRTLFKCSPQVPQLQTKKNGLQRKPAVTVDVIGGEELIREPPLLNSPFSVPSSSAAFHPVNRRNEDTEVFRP